MANNRVSLLMRDGDDISKGDTYIVVTDGVFSGWYERDEGGNDWQCWSEDGENLGRAPDILRAGNAVSSSFKPKDS